MARKKGSIDIIIGINHYDIAFFINIEHVKFSFFSMIQLYCLCLEFLKSWKLLQGNTMDFN